jgi:DNA-binding winged helix-turn-helix (wHTH) protein
VLRFGVFEADLGSGELRKNGTRIRLQEQPFQLLAFLLQHPQQVISRAELREKLWAADTFVDFDHSLNTAINKLREALRDSAANPRFIETKARRGYRFIAPVQVIPNGTGPSRTPTTSQPAESAPRPPQSDLPHAHRGLTRALLGLVQVMYLSFYVIALARLGEVGRISEQFLVGHAWILVVLVFITALLGIPVRLYLLTAVGFDYPKTGEKFLRMFPAILVLDIVWALAPFLCMEKIGVGLAFAATAGLLYLPFSQRTLVRMTYTQ